jgi:prepilin-type N-terminal cleavage/methylation domain-containing protein
MKRFHKNKRDAFSMIELIFVIVILGVVASLGSEMIAKVYKSYILQRAQHRAEIKTELAALQIANRLAAAIPGTVVRKDATGSSPTGGGTVEEITGPMSLPSNSYTVLQWVGADMDSFNAIGSNANDRKPGWSGFVDLNTSDSTHLDSKGSKLSRARTIITNLNGGTFPVGFSPAVYFPGDPNHYDINNLGVASDTNITLTSPLTRIVEHYKLAWTSYALSVENGDLYLYYSFDPIPGWPIPNGTSKSLLLRNVTTFKFRGDGRTIRFKICAWENIGEDCNITACKEKAVF